MRVISGTLRGHRLKFKQGRIRPTEGKVREAVFNIIAGEVPEARVLDLYAGTGAMGIEALSRGAFNAVFVDASRDSARLIGENIEAMGLGERARVIVKKAHPALKILAVDKAKFDLAFLDPPYKSEEVVRSLESLASLDLMAPAGIIIVEHHEALKLSDRYGKLGRYDRRRYGGTAVSFYSREEEDEEPEDD